MKNIVVVSFYAGSQYYYEAAKKLKKNCEDANIEYKIEELYIPDNFDWSDICRLKVKFYYDKLRELKKPIIWLDVDSELRFIPEFLLDSKIDFAAFQRGFNDLTTFNSIKFARTWAPSFLYFNYNDGGLSLTESMYNVEKAYKGKATDDFFLEEGWRAVGKNLVALPIPRKFLSINYSNENAAFEFGDSGNVAEFKSQVDQHENERMGNFLADIISKWINTSKNATINKFLYDKLHALKIIDLDVLLKLANIGKNISPLYALKYAVQAAALYPRKYEAKKVISELLLQVGRTDDAKQVLEELSNNEYDDWKSYGKAKLNDFIIDEKIKKAKLNNKKSIPLWWAKTPYPGNFGDILNPYLIEKMTGIPPTFVSKGKPGLIAIGSVIKWAHYGNTVWGSGTSRDPETLSPLAIYKSVRGPISRKNVLLSGGYCPEIYGDPALLLPRYYKPKVKKKYKLGYIPHYQHLDIKFGGDAKLINVLRVSNEDIEAFINEVCECEMIISTSLHGIIIAHAYGIPAQWAIISNAEKQIHGDNIKYVDYFLGVGLPVQTPIDLKNFDVLESSIFKTLISKNVDLKFDANKLLNAFPYQELLH